MSIPMVQVVENRADIDGRVLAVAPIADRPEHRLVTIEVSGVSPVEGYANLFTGAPGTRLDVILPAALARTLRVGGSVGCRIRRGGADVHERRPHAAGIACQFRGRYRFGGELLISGPLHSAAQLLH